MSPHLFPVFSSAHSSCVSISVKPPVSVSSHPNSLQWGCLPYGSPQTLFRFPIHFSKRIGRCVLLCRTQTFFPSRSLPVFIIPFFSVSKLSPFLSISLRCCQLLLPKVVTDARCMVCFCAYFTNSSFLLLCTAFKQSSADFSTVRCSCTILHLLKTHFSICLFVQVIYSSAGKQGKKVEVPFLPAQYWDLALWPQTMIDAWLQKSKVAGSFPTQSKIFFMGTLRYFFFFKVYICKQWWGDREKTLSNSPTTTWRFSWKNVSTSHVLQHWHYTSRSATCTHLFPTSQITTNGTKTSQS